MRRGVRSGSRPDHFQGGIDNNMSMAKGVSSSDGGKQQEVESASSGSSQEADSSPQGTVSAMEAGSCCESTAECAELQKKLEIAEMEKQELAEKLLRRQADFENFRKRIIREKEETVRYGNSALLMDLVGVIDDFERAIKSASASDSMDFQSFLSGVELIESQLVGMLDKKYGLKRFDSVDEDFDPQKHEALSMEDSLEHKTMVVLEDYQKGYMLHDRVLRHAKVRVSNPVAEKTKKEDPEETSSKTIKDPESEGDKDG